MFRELDLKQEIITAPSPQELDKKYEEKRLELKKQQKIIRFCPIQVVSLNNSEPFVCLYIQQILYRAD